MIPVLSRDDCLAAFRKMLLIRRFEEACIDAAQEHKVPGHFHVYIGQEATGVGVASVLDKGDYVHSTHRNHGHLLARGADPRKALAEILGKATGYAGGKAGTLHGCAPDLNFPLSSGATGYAGGKAGTLHGCAPDLNFPLSSGIVAGILPISTGTALALKHRGQKNVSAVFFGEGAMEEGAAYEALNLAALWKLPVLFICENNTAEVERKPGGGQYHAPNLSILELTDLAKSMGLATAIVDGSDLGAVWSAARTARHRAVSGEGATFLEVRTETWPGGQWPTLVTGRTDIRHAWTREIPKDYARHAAWFERNDPILIVAREMLAVGMTSEDELGKIDAAVRREMDDAVRFANESPFPDVLTATTQVWPH